MTGFGLQAVFMTLKSEVDVNDKFWEYVLEYGSAMFWIDDKTCVPLRPGPTIIQ